MIQPVDAGVHLSNYPPIHYAKARTMTKKNEVNPIENYVNSLGVGWCIKYVLIAIVEDEDGDQSFCVQCPDTQTAAETIGLCEAVSFVQKSKISDAWLTREMLEDDDE